MTVKDNGSREVIMVDPSADKGEFRHIGGSASDDFNLLLFNAATKTQWLAHSDAETRAVQHKAVAAALVGIAPRDETEAMLGAQLIGIHAASMECLRRAMIDGQTFAGRPECLNQANKLSRTYATLLDALNRHRGKGQQTVRVEYVTVNAGGQAIVGNIEAGGGANAKIRGQSHAKLAHAPEPALWRQDESREAVPVSSDGEWAVPDARRD
jgi:hypothetical protein